MKRIGETQIEQEIIINFFKETLNYEYVSGNTIDNSLIVEEDLLRFLRSPINQKNYNYLLNNVFNSEEEFLKEAKNIVAEKILYYSNTAFLLRKGIIIRDKKFELFETMYNSYGYNKDFNENIFTISNQVNYKINFENIKKTYHRIPDIFVFVNGIPFSLIEFKYANRYNQTAHLEGRKQILMRGYKDLCVNYLYPELEFLKEDQADNFKNDVLKIFERPVHCITLDMEETYIHRSIRNLQQSARKVYEKKEFTDEDFYEEGLSKFHLLPQKNMKDLNLMKKVSDSLTQLYSPENINNEIYYYNFNDKTELRSPRPNQKFGVDKTINRIKYLYENEQEKHLCLDELEKELSDLPESLKQDILEKRGKFKNNKEVYSMLLQYSAGFGKSLIIAWLALRLKDFYINDNPMFNKVLIVADRLDLRDQMSKTMSNMNINKSMIEEVDTSSKLKKSLSNKGAKIIIVNIQKFKNEESLNKIFTNDIKKDLSDGRIAFIIDEIHRSNSGSQHHNMKNLFDDLHNNVESIKSNKKNLIIGLTATPSDQVLARFGEYSECHGKDIIWKPFDSFTMNDAIKDGYVLDPTKNVIPYAIEPEIDTAHYKSIKEKKEIFSSISNKQYYEDENRLKIISNFVIKFCMEKSFKLVRCRGKSMLATYSISSAKKLFDNLKNDLEKYFEENPKIDKESFLEKFKLSIVYTGSESNNDAKELNGGKTERQVINEFKECKNGIIVVVDKLQTGFDVPELNTLFVDKAIRGITCVQTCCRVNRTTKNKEDCFIVDFSRNNENVTNIKSAFAEYANLKTSSLDPIDHIEHIKDLYKKITKNSIFRKTYPLWENIQSGIDPEKNSVEIQNYAKIYKKNDEYMLVDFIEKSENYLKRIGIIKDIVDVDNKYIIKDFYDLLKEIKNSVYEKTNRNKAQEVSIFFEEDNHGYIDKQADEKSLNNDFDVKRVNVNFDTDTTQGVASLLAQMLQMEENHEKIKEFKLLINQAIEKIIENDKKVDNRKKLINEIKKVDGNEDEINNYFGKYLNQVIRKSWRKDDNISSDFIKLVQETVKNDILRLLKKYVLENY
mgnify:CR=1 FL=1|tara:strand:- start:19100 stop:22300 length:3201 start_codon:yes stop_codon:yes gene_type:complete